MADEKLIDKNWVDIVPITIVDQPDYFLLTLLATGIVLILVLVAYIFTRQPAATIKRRLKSLAIQVKNQNNKSILQDMEKALCNYFQVTHLSLVNISETSIAKTTWSEFKSRLHEACYAPTPPDNKTTQELISQAQYFFRHLTS